MIYESQFIFGILFAIPALVAFSVAYIVKLITRSEKLNYIIAGSIMWTLFVVEILWVFDII